MKNWYALPADDVFASFETNVSEGLTESDVHKNRLKFGENSVPSAKSTSDFVLLLSQFQSPIIYILIAAGIVNFIVSDIEDTLVICFVIFLNSLIGFIQEKRSAIALQSLKNLTAPIAKVLREGMQKTISANEIVCGDILLLESGVKVAADCRLIESYNLSVDESLLTGESLSVIKNHSDVLNEDTIVADHTNMVYAGTVIHRGRAKGVVTAVGSKTEIGKISQNIIEAETQATPLEQQIAQFGKKLSIAIGIAILIIFIIGFLRGIEAKEMLLTSIGLAVSAIPEGLPVSVTIALTIGVYKMAQYKAVVRRLAAVETLGSTNVICTDKTGTLTKNEMSVKYLWINDKEFLFSGLGYEKSGFCIDKTGNRVDANSYYDTKMAFTISATCSETTLNEEQRAFTFTGDPTEAAMMIAGKKAGFESELWKTSVLIPFESEHRLMAAKAVCTTGNEEFIVVKGSPETLLPRCSTMIGERGEILAITTEHLSGIAHHFASDGYRVLALAYSGYTKQNISINTLAGLTFAGFMVLEDSVRPEAVKSVQESHNAGIRVIMITGDHKQTAVSIAREVGISDSDTNAMTGVQLEELNDDGLATIVQKTDVFARVAPHHKLRIVKALQQTGNIVAMTGDGVNDAPALKKADIGIAMGSGSDVAKEAASMVILDDNFATIVHAVRRGRTIVQNLQHILLYVLTTSLGGILTIAVSVIAGMHLPILPTQLLWINLVTDGTSTFPLAFEKEHGNVMSRKPRAKSSSLISKFIVERIIVAALLMMVGTIGIFVYSHIYEGYSHSKAQTMAFCTLALFQIWNVQNSRSSDRSLFFNWKGKNGTQIQRIGLKSNMLSVQVMFIALFLQVIAVNTPIMNTFLKTQPLSFSEWGFCILTSFTVIVVVEIHKFIRRNM